MSIIRKRLENKRKRLENQAEAILNEHGGAYLTSDRAREIAKAIQSTQAVVELARKRAQEASDNAEANFGFTTDAYR